MQREEKLSSVPGFGGILFHRSNSGSFLLLTLEGIIQFITWVFVSQLPFN